MPKSLGDRDIATGPGQRTRRLSREKHHQPLLPPLALSTGRATPHHSHTTADPSSPTNSPTPSARPRLARWGPASPAPALLARVRCFASLVGRDAAHEHSSCPYPACQRRRRRVLCSVAQSGQRSRTLLPPSCPSVYPRQPGPPEEGVRPVQVDCQAARQQAVQEGPQGCGHRPAQVPHARRVPRVPRARPERAAQEDRGVRRVQARPAQRHAFPGVLARVRAPVPQRPQVRLDRAAAAAATPAHPRSSFPGTPTPSSPTSRPSGWTSRTCRSCGT